MLPTLQIAMQLDFIHKQLNTNLAVQFLDDTESSALMDRAADLSRSLWVLVSNDRKRFEAINRLAETIIADVVNASTI